MRDHFTRPLPATRRVVLMIALSSLLSFVHARSVRAATEEIEATGRYHLGDNDTKLDGHRLALMEAKRNALEKAGTYVESITEVKDFQLTRDDIRTYTAGIIAVEEEGDPKWEMVGSTLRCTVTVKARIDKDSVTNRIGALRKNKEATDELRGARKNAEDNERKVADLNRKLKKAKKGSAEAQRVKESRDNALAGVDAATLRAQGVAAKHFSKEEWEQFRGFVNRNVNLKGCMPFKTTETAQGAANGDAGLLFFAAPALALAVCKPRGRRPRRSRITKPLARNAGNARGGKEST